MSILPPLKSLRAFDAVARCRSVTKAAADLDVTQSAVSQQIRTLETALGYSLFMRESQGLGLTAKGKSLAPYIRQGFEAFEAGIAKTTRLNAQIQIAISTALWGTGVVDQLRAFQRDKRQVSLWLGEVNFADTLESLPDVVLLKRDEVAKAIPLMGHVWVDKKAVIAEQELVLLSGLDPEVSDSLKVLVAWMSGSAG